MSDVPYTPPQQELDLSFTYLIFQPNPKRDVVYLWMDGDKAKKTVKISLFYAIMQQKNPELLAKIQQVCNTYSFYMVSSTSTNVIKLTPSGKGDLQYKDPVMAHLTGRAVNTGNLPEQKTLMDVIGEYGFAPVSEQDANELRVVVKKKDIDERQSMLSRILNLKRK